MGRGAQRALLAGSLAALVACSASQREAQPVAVRVSLVGYDRVAGAPVVYLEERDGERELRIWIGLGEARSIDLALADEATLRPNTHDLATALLGHLDAHVEHVFVSELREDTFYAQIHLIRGDQRFEVDARPSDAIAIALRSGAPILVNSSLFESLELPDAPPPDLIEPPSSAPHDAQLSL